MGQTASDIKNKLFINFYYEWLQIKYKHFKSIDINSYIKKEIISAIDRHKNNDDLDKFHEFKIKTIMTINYAKQLYPKYASKLNELIYLFQIKNKNIFEENIKNKINNTNDSFELYLIFLLVDVDT